MENLIFDLATGEETRVPLTAAELAEVAARPAAAAVLEAAQAERLASSADLAAQYDAAVTRLNQIAAFDATTTAAQVRQGVADLAVILKRTLRLLKAELT